MFHLQLPYRELLEQIDSVEDNTVFWLIDDWLLNNPGENSWLVSLANVDGASVPTMEAKELSRLYALSRVSDALITRGCSNPLIREDYVNFMERLGLRRFNESSFHPFYHEVVHVEAAAAPDEPVAIQKVNWPGYMCGPLMVARAGVSVAGGTNHIRKEVAEKSTLYWAYRRADRPTTDLSVGWGHNSQWRTSFRRDYRLGDTFHYNVDGTREPQVPDVSAAESAELLRHRCFIISAVTDGDLFPYGAQLRDG